MSYNDDFASMYSHLENADITSRSMEMLGVLVEVPNRWFVLHGLRPRGLQNPSRMTWFLTVGQIYNLWRDSNPRLRWKEVY